MYVLVDGLGRFDYGFAWEPPGASKPESKNWFEHLTVGQSFGEEVIFGLAETYLYTIVALHPSTLISISEDGFKERFKNMPDVHDAMYKSFLRSKSEPALASQEGMLAVLPT